MATLSPEVQEFVRHERLGYIATVSPDGTPNLSPKGSLTVWDDRRIMFADIESPHTIRNLDSNPKVEVNVVNPFTRRGYRFRGLGTVLRSGSDYWKAVDHYKNEGADIRRIRAIVLIDVQEVGPLLSPVYLLGLNEADVRRLWEEYHVKSLAKTVVDLVPPNDF
jgi:predicted pyridoxine 5'-phosphate oxidase superfamily flavin-nucleotide-binding protein